jgi:hypothetical protein
MPVNLAHSHSTHRCDPEPGPRAHTSWEFPWLPNSRLRGRSSATIRRPLPSSVRPYHRLDGMFANWIKFPAACAMTFHPAPPRVRCRLTWTHTQLSVRSSSRIATPDTRGRQRPCSVVTLRLFVCQSSRRRAWPRLTPIHSHLRQPVYPLPIIDSTCHDHFRGSPALGRNGANPFSPAEPREAIVHVSPVACWVSL